MSGEELMPGGGSAGEAKQKHMRRGSLADNLRTLHDVMDLAGDCVGSW